jgi:hypothetical protein
VKAGENNEGRKTWGAKDENATEVNYEAWVLIYKEGFI